MGSNKPKASAKKFTFKHTRSVPMAAWKRGLLWLVRIPAYDILFLGITASLGTLGLWAVERMINPQPGSDQSLTVLANDNGSSIIFTAALWVLLVGLAVLFWVGAAYFTRKTVIWLAESIGLTKLFLAFRIGLLTVAWLPLVAVFSSANNDYSGQVITAGAACIIIGSALFFIETLLTSYWKIKELNY